MGEALVLVVDVPADPDRAPSVEPGFSSGFGAQVAEVMGYFV